MRKQKRTNEQWYKGLARLRNTQVSDYQDLQTTYRDGWYIRSARGRSGTFTAWAKREMFESDDLITETGEVYFEFGATRENAINKLLDEVRKLTREET